MKSPDASRAGEFDAMGHEETGHEIGFVVSSNYGHGDPHFYVCLDAGENSWWFDPDQAEALGINLQQLATRCRRQNVEEERLRQLPEGGWVDGPPDT